MGVMETMVKVLVKDLDERGGLNLSESFIDGTVVAAKKGGRGGKDQAG